MPRFVRRVYWSVMVGLFLLSSLGANMKNDSLIGFGVFWMIAWWFVGAAPARWIAAMLLSSLRCKHCGLEIPAVGRWRIGSFQDHRDRHIFLAKSPIDGARVGHIDCPQCSATILV